MNSSCSLLDTSDGVDVDALEGAVRLLIEHARRDDAVALVRGAVDLSSDRRVFLLLARLELESGTQAGAAAAVEALDLCRCDAPWDLDVIVLLRGALRVLGRSAAACELDRGVRWTSGAARSRVRSADKERA